jgi:hypothetical protein
MSARRFAGIVTAAVRFLAHALDVTPEEPWPAPVERIAEEIAGTEP